MALWRSVLSRLELKNCHHFTPANPGYSGKNLPAKSRRWKGSLLMDELKRKGVWFAHKVILMGFFGVFFLAIMRVLKPPEMNWIPAAEVDKMQVLRKNSLNWNPEAHCWLLSWAVSLFHRYFCNSLESLYPHYAHRHFLPEGLMSSCCSIRVP